MSDNEEITRFFAKENARDCDDSDIRLLEDRLNVSLPSEVATLLKVTMGKDLIKHVFFETNLIEGRAYALGIEFFFSPKELIELNIRVRELLSIIAPTIDPALVNELLPSSYKETFDVRNFLAFLSNTDGSIAGLFLIKIKGSETGSVWQLNANPYEDCYSLAKEQDSLADFFKTFHIKR